MFPGLLKQLLYHLVSYLLRHGYWNADLETLPVSTPSHQCPQVSSGVAQTPFKTAFAGIQGGPWTSPLPVVPRSWPSSLHQRPSQQHVAASPANRKFLLEFLTGAWVCSGSVVTDCSRFGVFPSPDWHPRLLHWNLPFHCSQELNIVFSLPSWDLAADYSFRVVFITERALFLHPTALKRGKQEAGQEFFWVWGVFVILRQRTRGGMQQLGLFPKLCFMKLTFQRKDKALLVSGEPEEAVELLVV